MRVLDDAKARFLDLLDGAVWEDALLLSVGEEAFDGAVREADLFGTVREVLLNLVVLELENLESVWERCLRSLSF